MRAQEQRIVGEHKCKVSCNQDIFFDVALMVMIKISPIEREKIP